MFKILSEDGRNLLDFEEETGLFLSPAKQPEKNLNAVYPWFNANFDNQQPLLNDSVFILVYSHWFTSSFGICHTHFYNKMQFRHYNFLDMSG